MLKYAIALIATLGFPAFAAEAPGQAQLIFDGNTAGVLGRPLDQFAGAGIQLEDVLPVLGRFTFHSESLGHDGRYQGGEDYVRLQGSWGVNLKWTLTGGDFRTPTNLLDGIFGNFWFPELTARGAVLELTRGPWRYTVFFGDETLPPSPNNLFRVLAPQRIFAGAAQRSIGKRLRIAARLNRVSSSPGQLAQEEIPISPFFAPPERRFAAVNGAIAQLIYTVSKQLRLYAEADPAAAGKTRVSSAAGAAWDSPRLTIKANYAHQGLTYAPWAGYGLGDRSGPFAEFRYQVTKRLVLNGSSSDYVNNLEHDPVRPDIRTIASTAGAALVLPWKLTAGAQMIDTGLTIRIPGVSPPIYAGNLQLAASLGRTVRAHNLRLYVRELRLSSADERVRRVNPEFEDVVQTKRFTAGGAVRLQDHFPGFRGIAETRLARFTAHADVETGNLTPSSVTARNSLGVANFRLSSKLAKTWTLEAQSSRVWLTNPQVLMRQWNVSFRLIKQLHI
jgi:hypothetical protein